MEILLLTRSDCGSCGQAKTVIDRLADEFGLEVSTLDMDSEEGSVLAERGGVMFPPGVFVDGKPFSYGRLSERKLRRELETRRASVGGT